MNSLLSEQIQGRGGNVMSSIGMSDWNYFEQIPALRHNFVIATSQSVKASYHTLDNSGDFVVMPNEFAMTLSSEEITSYLCGSTVASKLQAIQSINAPYFL